MKQKELNAKKEFVTEVHHYAITPPHDSEKRWKTYVNTDDGKRKLIAKTSEEDFFEYLFHFYNGDTQMKKKILPSQTSVEKLYPEWIKYKALHTNAPSYIKRIKGTWNAHYKNTEIVQLPLSQLNKLTLDEWVHKLIQDQDLTKKQYYNITIIMRQVLEYACDKEILDSNPFNKVKVDSRRMFRREQKGDDSNEVFTDAEIDKITVLAYTEYKNKVMTVHVLAPLAVLFQFQTGVRLGELCALRYEDIHGNYIRVNRMVTDDSNCVVEHNKGNAEARDVFLTEVAKNIINEAHEYQIKNGCPSEGYIFSVNENPIRYRSVMRMYDRYCKAIGTEHKSSHKARKTYISCLIDAGVNINTVRKMAGHADEKTTLRNYVFDRSEESERNEMIEKALEYRKG